MHSEEFWHLLYRLIELGLVYFHIGQIYVNGSIFPPSLQNQCHCSTNLSAYALGRIRVGGFGPNTTPSAALDQP